MNFLDARQIDLCEAREQTRLRGRDQQPQSPTHQREHQAFGQQLTDQIAAAGAQCRSHGELLAPACSASQ